MSASAALPGTLKAITATKIQELSKQRQNYEISKKRIIQGAERQPDLLSKVRAVVDGSCHLEGFPILDDDKFVTEDYGLSHDLRNKRRFLRQAQVDPSFSPTVLRQFGQELSRDLELKSQGHIHAEFFSKLVTEWLSDSDQADVKLTEQTNEPLENSASFEDIGRKEMHEQRAEWDSLVFKKKETDSKAIHEYLTKLFTSNKTNKEAHEVIRRKVLIFGTTSEAGSWRCDSDFLKTSIKGLILTDLLSEEKNAILKAFLSNNEVLSEICDVLNMRLMSLSTWSWSTGEGNAIPLEMRKHLNGKYRVYMDEDVLDALMLHAIGLRWAVEFKSIFTEFFDSRAWHRSDRPIPQADRERREYFLGEEIHRFKSVQDARRDRYGQDYFLTQLPENTSEGTRDYDGDCGDEVKSSRKGLLDTKHSLLHLLITETLLATRIHADFTVVRSDFKWFGPSLPHSTIFAVLRFFGMSEKWICFFTRFLQAPLRFKQDGPKGEVRTRVRGVPISHALSDVFGESLLFCMDYAVNQKTSGSFLYRLHDDFWFWGPEHICQQAWKAMAEFAGIMGIHFNQEKTGTVRLGLGGNQTGGNQTGGRVEVVVRATTSDILPRGEVRWGFLRLDSKTRRFLVDQTLVDEHIKELRLQLSHCTSIFSWIQAYNAYLARFFGNNFGKPSFAFGRAHVDMMIETFARIQQALFPTGSVTDHLRNNIEIRFGVKDLPDGFFYFPIRMGGLELRNPLIPLFGMRDSLSTTPDLMLEAALNKDEDAYHIAKERFQNKNTGAGLGRYNVFGLARNVKPEDGTFMTMDEFLRYREEKSRHLAGVYRSLLEVPAEKEIHKTPQIASWLEALTDKIKEKGRASGGSTTKLEPGIGKDWASMFPYWKWILAVHGAEVVQKYGSVRLVDEAKVPIGVVGVMKQGRVRWRG